MQTNSNRGKTLLRVLGWAAALVIACGVIFSSTFMIGPVFFAVPGLSEKIMTAIYCPGAVTTSSEEGTSTATTTSPSGTYGHTVEITCTFADGSQKVITNEQAALGSIGGVFGLGAGLGMCVSIPILLAPLFLFRNRKTSGQG